MSKQVSARHALITMGSPAGLPRLGIVLAAGVLLAACTPIPVPPVVDGGGVDNGGGADNGCTPACATGENCENGQCVAVDPCAGVNCDAGSSCVNGQCVMDQPTSTGGDATAGAAYYSSHGCATCHCADATGGCLLDAPSLTASGAQILLEKNDGTKSHSGGPVAGITQQDADDMAAWLASL